MNSSFLLYALPLASQGKTSLKPAGAPVNVRGIPFYRYSGLLRTAWRAVGSDHGCSVRGGLAGIHALVAALVWSARGAAQILLLNEAFRVLSDELRRRVFAPRLERMSNRVRNILSRSICDSINFYCNTRTISRARLNEHQYITRTAVRVANGASLRRRERSRSSHCPPGFRLLGSPSCGE